MSERHDFLASCAVGDVLRTRDRRDARIVEIDRERGIITGEVTMFGTCRWRADGVYADSPAGVAGPLDLAPPATGPAPRQRHVSVVDAINDEGRAACCD